MTKNLADLTANQNRQSPNRGLCRIHIQRQRAPCRPDPVLFCTECIRSTEDFRPVPIFIIMHGLIAYPIYFHVSLLGLHFLPPPCSVVISKTKKIPLRGLPQQKTYGCSRISRFRRRHNDSGNNTPCGTCQHKLIPDRNPWIQKQDRNNIAHIAWR